IHHLFEAQVERTPDAVALVFGDQELTYRELNQRANKVAHYLQGLGIGPEELVGIFMQRSIEMVVALLGVLKAGGAYVPLDPAYPPERLGFVIEDAHLAAIVTDPRLAAKLPPHAAPVLVLETDDARESAPPPLGLSADSL